MSGAGRTGAGAGLRDFVEQRPCVLQIARLEAFGEPAVDGCKQVAGVAGPVLTQPQPGEAGSGAEFQHHCVLVAGDAEDLVEAVHGLRHYYLRQAA